MVKIVADSYAWVELFLGSEAGLRVKKSLEDAEGVITPGTVLAEIARKYLREGLQEATVKKRLATILEASEVLDIDEAIAVGSARAYLELFERSRSAGLRDPSLFDAIVLASARLTGAKVLTGDEHFKGLAETLWLKA